ncbi:hypothetical protein BRADI_1g28422v3 [Brachypodium distachyon]|uniref:Bifunctional inhibitor/plant lipid transfer protein/seed storage helical domain-containing protein n=1 Tax=Brachypodium distachyon TaxID=15368 RepID=I1GUP0_BRADI|nr:hypothetical protein BRADI_1g28422v3 [Brachypodium distachyon]
MAAAGWFLVFMAAAVALFTAPTAAAAGRPRPTTPASAASLDCGTVTSVLTGCGAFVRRGPNAAAGLWPGPGTACCEGVAGLYAVAADSADNWRSVCRCMAELVREYWSNASAIALLPGLCAVSPAAHHAFTYCTSVP